MEGSLHDDPDSWDTIESLSLSFARYITLVHVSAQDPEFTVSTRDCRKNLAVCGALCFLCDRSNIGNVLYSIL